MMRYSLLLIPGLFFQVSHAQDLRLPRVAFSADHFEMRDAFLTATEKAPKLSEKDQARVVELYRGVSRGDEDKILDEIRKFFYENLGTNFGYDPSKRDETKPYANDDKVKADHLLIDDLEALYVGVVMTPVQRKRLSEILLLADNPFYDAGAVLLGVLFPRTFACGGLWDPNTGETTFRNPFTKRGE